MLFLKQGNDFEKLIMYSKIDFLTALENNNYCLKAFLHNF
jgi:hypothetical protein